MNLKVKRIINNMTQEELAKNHKFVGLTISKIENIGSENVQVKILRKIVKALNSTVHEVFWD